MKVDKKEFFLKHNVDFNLENIQKYNNGWTFPEIQKGEEFIIQNYKKEVDLFFNLQNEGFY